MNERAQTPNRASSPNGLRLALAAWRRAIGAKHVHTERAEVAPAETATFPTDRRVAAVISPADRAEVQTCLRIANRYRIPIYPSSRGKNWGYGSRVPSSGGNVIMDLSRMTRIVAHSERLAYVTIEPGVTFGQLYDFLRTRRSRLVPPWVGSSPEASVIGNSVERGLGQKTDTAFAESCALEVVLPTGECISTGFSRFAKAAAGPLDRWGVGPCFDGLFSQSSLGIVTRMTVWLSVYPAFRDLVQVGIDDDSTLATVIDAIREARLAGTLKSRVLIKNRCRMFAMKSQYPWEATGGRTPLPRAVEDRIDQEGFHRWTAVVELGYGSLRQRTAERRLVVKLLGQGGGKVTVVPISARTPPTRGGMDLPLMYWRKKSLPSGPINPDADGCGMLLLAPVLPFDGRVVTAYLRGCERTIRAHGLEPVCTIRCHTPRSVMAIIYLIYDRDVEGEDARALACWRKLFDDMTAKRFFPYRLGIQGMNSLPTSIDDYSGFFTKLKRCLDPNHILAPGRYES